jgi:uncharacterized protein
MRLVVDTNTIISALFWMGAPAQLLALVREQKHEFFSSQPLLTELAEVLNRDKFRPHINKAGQTSTSLVDQWISEVSVVDFNALRNPISRDRDDDVVLACAKTAKANAIISGDKDLLVLQQFEGIPILTAAQALAWMRQGNTH